VDHRQIGECPSGGGDLWVFGYGSLMWEPGFSYAEAVPARLGGYHRALCLLSIRYRGTPERPGLVLALDRGGSCRGLAFRVAVEHAEATRAYLWAREMPTEAYLPRELPVRLGDGRRVAALAFVARREHSQYFRPESAKQAAGLVVQGCGPRGSSLDYLRNVVCRLDDFGITDVALHRVLALAEQRSR
jgi:cation transport protein ChaC